MPTARPLVDFDLILMSNSIILNRDGINLQFTDEITVDLDQNVLLATDA